MKIKLLICLFTISANITFAQNVANDSVQKSKITTVIEWDASFPGGITGFFRFIRAKIKYTEVALLVGLKGKVNVKFTVEKDGRITNAFALDTIGAECEAEAVRIVLASPLWRPAARNGVGMALNFSVAVPFDTPKDLVQLAELKSSKYGFVFNIDGKIHTIDEVRVLWGPVFQSAIIEKALATEDVTLKIPGKTKTYILHIR